MGQIHSSLVLFIPPVLHRCIWLTLQIIDKNATGPSEHFIHVPYDGYLEMLFLNFAASINKRRENLIFRFDDRTLYSSEFLTPRLLDMWEDDVIEVFVDRFVANKEHDLVGAMEFPDH